MNELAIHSKIVQAHRYAQERKILHAVQELESIVREVPQSEAAWWELAHIYIDQRHFDAAERSIARAIKVVRDKSQFDFLLAKLHFVNGEKGKALVELERLNKDSSAISVLLRAEVAFYLGVLERDRNRLSVAEMLFIRVRTLHAQFPRINESIAELQITRGALAEATSSLKRAIDIDPTSWMAFHLLGLVKMKQGKFSEALEHFEAAVDMNPEETSIWGKCGETLLLLERVEEAERYLRKALKLDGEHVETLITFSRLLIRQGKHADAREMVSRALNLQPSNKEGRTLQREIERFERGKF
jgi:Tfp pilus assembly protein PilF